MAKIYPSHTLYKLRCLFPLIYWNAASRYGLYFSKLLLLVNCDTLANAVKMPENTLTQSFRRNSCLPLKISSRMLIIIFFLRNFILDVLICNGFVVESDIGYVRSNMSGLSRTNIMGQILG